MAFLNIAGIAEVLVFILIFTLIIAVANYGRNTILGYWGSVLLALISTPLIAYIIILLLKRRSVNN